MKNDRFREPTKPSENRYAQDQKRRDERVHTLSELMKHDNRRSASQEFVASNVIFQPASYFTRVNEKQFSSPPDALPVFDNPVLECITVRLTENTGFGEILERLGQGWSSEPVNLQYSPNDFDLLPHQQVSVEQAWNIVHELRSDEQIILAEPSWLIDTVVEETISPKIKTQIFDESLNENASVENKFWAPELIRIQQAWELPLPESGKVHGEGIRIAHPDSGYCHLEELWKRPESIDFGAGFDFFGDDRSTFDDYCMEGSDTASVVMSGNEGDILGIAPKVTLIPMKVAQKGPFARPAPTQLRASMRQLRKAIDLAIETDCHVISISVGWLGHSALQDVIQRAWRNNILIIAAAGNYTGQFITSPAKYSECICIAGCNVDGEIWKGSARGTRVDFLAPAQNVWKAGFDNGEAIAMQSSSTSFATSMTAGVAALWLAFHGRDKLLERYGTHGVPLTEVFRHILKTSADPTPRVGFGGLINAEKALAAALPDPQEVCRTFVWEALNNQSVSARSPSLATTLDILGDDYRQIRHYLANCLNVPENNLERIAANCGDELAFHMILEMAQPETTNRGGLNAAPAGAIQMSDFLKSRLADQ